ncbi:M20/M25/M40 family metallo-hydrolase [Pontibacter silvestris]|uniref:Vacuolar membrane protease n=1 Tax=Pontibacter silvestris TaxID=2305183 RepID=A0ABW4X3V9_9BACT|nr:M20/M25/M40 family metallo-hydrolase [Pontibacter silvestris]MCC9137130.1 M20/M25/M40 family metallo-hydrolase [Pontibacter silvestris]
MSMRLRNILLSVFLLFAVTAISLLSVYLLQPPQALPADAPAQEFSSGRAMDYVRQIAAEPHAMGTPAHDRVRDYLVSQMEQLRLSPQVQEATVVRQAGKAAFAAYVQNVIGRLKGTGSGKALLLMAHYDSQPSTPGAGDDAAGVAALLETARVLQQSDPLQNDVIFLLTDGEEYGLNGARAFMQHPWLKDVGLVINLEGRGNRGPSFTFEVSPENGWLMQEFAKAAPYPIAGSVMYEVYKRMPNDTDFSITREAGIVGVNSALVNGFVNYHSMTDTPDNLDQNSLQHHGRNTLALARHFGNLSLENAKSRDRVFFNPVGKWLVQYPVGNNLLWVGILTLLFVVTWKLGTKRKVFKIGQVLLGGLLYLLMLAVIGALCWFINPLVLETMPYYTAGGTYNTDSFFAAYLLLALGAYLFLSWLVTRWMKVFSLAMGAHLVWLVLLGVVLFTVMNAAYILLFPLLFSMVGLLLVLKFRLYEKPGNWGYGIVLLVAAVPGLFMMGPIVYLLFVIFDLALPVAMVLLLGLLAGILLPLLLLIDSGFRLLKVPVLSLVLLGAGVVVVFISVDKEKPSAAQPAKTQLSYFFNADTRDAFWASLDKTPDTWSMQYLGADALEGPLTSIYPHASLSYLQAPARLLELKAPEAEVLQDSVAGGRRFIKIQLSSPRQAQHLELILKPEQGSIISAVALNNMPVSLEPLQTPEGDIYYTRLLGLPQSKAATLNLQTSEGSSFNLIVYDQSIGLPLELLQNNPRPKNIIPAPGWYSNTTVVRKTYRF